MLLAKNDQELEKLSSHMERVHYFRKKISRNFTDYGLWISCKKTMAYLLRPFYQKVIYYIYELDLNKSVSQRAQNSKYIFRLIHHDEDNLIDQIEHMEEWLSGSLKNKLQHNCLCMVTLDGDKVIGFNYVAIGEGNIPLLKLKVITGPKEAWSEQITISSEYRKQGLASALRNTLYRELRARGIERLYGHRQEFNVGSKQSARRYTVRVMVRSEYKKILWIQRLKLMKYESVEPKTHQYCYLRASAFPDQSDGNDPATNSAEYIFIAGIEDLR